ncbi:MAG: hypothetical protein PHZ25_03190 [Candidatus Pacebacteria bacterium]|nr:hypothetical protein [Candidatus Paceibacterota bacterium]
MSTTITTAQSLSRKLQTFRETLANEEKAALDELLIYFSNKVTASSGGAAILKVSNGKQILEEIKKTLPSIQANKAITPTVTTVTITTTIASHPIITCSKLNTSIKGIVINK